MRIYGSVYDCFTETVREVFSRGLTAFDPTVQGKVVGPEYEMKELIGYAYKLKRFDDLKEALDWWRQEFKRDWVSLEVAKKWADDMFRPDNPDSWWRGTSMEEYWMKFSTLGELGRFEYTYGERLCPQLGALIEKIRANPAGKGHFITVWYQHDISSFYQRKPCTIGYQFILRPERNVLVVYQRSCDLVNFFPMDVAKAILFGQRVFAMVGRQLDEMIHFIGSLHAYKIDVPPQWRW